MTAGELLTYTLVITNYGGAAATGVAVTDTLPVSGVPSCRHARLQQHRPAGLARGSLGVGATRTFTVVVTVAADARGVITNTRRSAPSSPTRTQTTIATRSRRQSSASPTWA